MQHSDFQKQLLVQLCTGSGSPSSPNREHVLHGYVDKIVKMAYGKQKSQVLNRIASLMNFKCVISRPLKTNFFWQESSYSDHLCHADLLFRTFAQNLLNGKHSNLIDLCTTFDESSEHHQESFVTKGMKRLRPAAIMDEMKPNLCTAESLTESDDNANLKLPDKNLIIVMDSARGCAADLSGGTDDVIEVSSDDDDDDLGMPNKKIIRSNSSEYGGECSTAFAILDRSFEDDGGGMHEIKPNLIAIQLMDSSDDEDDISVKLTDETPIDNEYESLLKLYHDNSLIFNPESVVCGKCVTMCEPMSGVLLRDCLHSFCRQCIREVILTNDGTELVKCLFGPCDGFVQEEEIKSLLSQDEFVNFKNKKESARNTESEYYKLKNLDEEKMILSTEPFECPICMEACMPQNGIKLRNCLHDICQPCCKELIRHDDNPSDVKCCVCQTLIEEREIRGLLTAAEYAVHLERVLRSSVQQLTNSFLCRTADCTGFFIVENGDVDFLCPICNHVNCLPCEAIHEQLTCAQYQDASSGKDALTKQHIDMLIATGSAMRCPGPSCGAIITKKQGCDGMQCTMCKIHICWATKGPRWGPAGPNDVSGGCRCNINGRRCHPKCGNCH